MEFDPTGCVEVVQGGVKTVLYQPNPKLIPFHASEAPYCLTAGGRNSGKSTALRWDAHMRNLAIPGHRALLLRRTFPQLRGSHFDRTAVEGKLLGCPKPFNQSYYYLDYANGSKLVFGHCESDAAILDYLSQEWDWVGFDELTTFTFDQFIRISASARTSKKTGRVAFVKAATNPIGEGASWVKRYFIDHSVTFDENPDYNPAEWQVIQANMSDNPHADHQAYERKLLMLPSEALRRAYKDGEWLVEGQFFSEFKETRQGKPWHCISELPKFGTRSILEVPWIEVTRFIDWGYSEAEPGYCGWIAHLPDGTALVFKEWVFTQRIPRVAAQIIKEMSEGMKIRYTVGDPMMWHKRTGESIAEIFGRNGVSIIEAGETSNDRVNGWVMLHSWLVETMTDSEGERPRLQFLNPLHNGLGVPYLIRTLPSLQVDPKKPSDVFQGSGVEDHGADALRYWAMSRPSPSREIRRSFAHWPKEVQAAIYGNSGDEGGILGSESVRR